MCLNLNDGIGPKSLPKFNIGFRKIESENIYPNGLRDGKPGNSMVGVGVGVGVKE